MSVEAYVFVECDEDPAALAADLRGIGGVSRADGLYGTLEVVALIEADDLKGLDGVIAAILDTDGVEFTDTRIVRDLG
ncbi:MAG: hypothetical protein ACE5NC_09270 [Anaerolineae bacterium]